MRKIALILSILILLTINIPVSAQKRLEKQLIAIGSGQTIVYESFLNSVISHQSNGIVKILLIPIANSPDMVSDLGPAEVEKFKEQIQEACNLLSNEAISCVIQSVPIFDQPDANSDDLYRSISPDLNAIIILGSDPLFIMQTIMGTKLERLLLDAYERGTIISGVESSGSILSKAMLIGYHPIHSSMDALNFGSIELWNDPSHRGLSFGVENAVIDVNIFHENKFARLLTAISIPMAPHIGIGIDSSTGVSISNGKVVDEVFGENFVTIVDSETYHSAYGVQYFGPNNSISLRNVLLHLLADGQISYDLETRLSELERPPERFDRSFSKLSIPDHAGVLIVGGNLENSTSIETIVTRFVNFSGGLKAKIAIVVSGYSSDFKAREAANLYAQFFREVEATITIISGELADPLILTDDITGILIIGDDQSTIEASSLEPVKNAWLRGTTVLADNAAAAAIGKFYLAKLSSSSEEQNLDEEIDSSLLFNRAKIHSGLSIVDAVFQPRMFTDDQWKSLFSVAYHDPTSLVFGISENTAIEFTQNGIFVQGENGIFVLDLSYAQIGNREGQGYVFYNGVLDVFAPGESVHPSRADIFEAPMSFPTPVLTSTSDHILSVTTPPATATPTSTDITPTPTVTITPRYIPTRTPRPTNTPPVIPPASDPGRSNLMISVLLLVVGIVIFGVWLNRQKIM